MKLRNKKTGKIGYLIGSMQSTFISVCIDYKDGNPKEYSYDSIEKLNEEWEDYKPKEPLIKDEKVRKAVRAWAEANNIEKVWLEYCDNRLAFRDEYFNCENGKHICIVFVTNDKYPFFDRCNTIEELCGEEEE